MLTPEALSSAWPLAERIDANNFVIRPVPGTPLDALVNATRADDEFVTPEPDGSAMFPQGGPRRPPFLLPPRRSSRPFRRSLR